jgi:DNA-binding transcriptional regulator YiaG
MMYSIVILKSILQNQEVRLFESLHGNLPEDTLPEKIFKLRKTHGLSYANFGTRIKRRASSVRGWEKGFETPSQKSIEKICDAFGLDVNSFSEAEE